MMIISTFMSITIAILSCKSLAGSHLLVKDGRMHQLLGKQTDYQPSPHFHPHIQSLESFCPHIRLKRAKCILRLGKMYANEGRE